MPRPQCVKVHVYINLVNIPFIYIYIYIYIYFAFYQVFQSIATRCDCSAVAGIDEQYTQQVEVKNKPSPGSTTLEDVLDSLLGLPPTSRSPSPGAGSASPGHCRPSHPPPQAHQHHSQRRSCGDLRSDLAGRRTV